MASLSDIFPRPAPLALERQRRSRLLRLAATAGVIWRARRDLLHLFHPEVAGLPWVVQPFGAARLITVNDPGLARHVLADNASAYVKGPLYEALLGDVLGGGSLLLEGEAARRRRRLIAPAFNAASMAKLEAVVARRVRETVETWAQACGEGSAEIDLSADCARMAMEIALEAFFGADLGPRSREVAATLDRLLIEGSTPSLADLLSLPRWTPRRSRARVRRMVREIDVVLYDLIDARRAAPERAGRDLLDALLQARDPETGAALDRRAVRDEVMTLFLAGHETTATSLAWGLDRIAREPDRQAELAAAARTGAADALGRAYEETLRLYPPAYVVAREAKEADRFDDLEIRPGDRVQIPIFVLHRNPRFWREPDAFQPARFRAPAPAAFMPFGAGPRACIGMALARLEGRLALGQTLERLRLAPAGPEPKPVGRVTLRPTATIRVRMTLRSDGEEPARDGNVRA